MWSTLGDSGQQKGGGEWGVWSLEDPSHCLLVGNSGEARGLPHSSLPRGEEVGVRDLGPDRTAWGGRAAGAWAGAGWESCQGPGSSTLGGQDETQLLSFRGWGTPGCVRRRWGPHVCTWVA